MPGNLLQGKWLRDESGQAAAEYILVFAAIALALAGLLAAWKLPLAKYLTAIAQAIAKPR